MHTPYIPVRLYACQAIHAAFLQQAATDYQRLSPHPERWQAFEQAMFTLYATEPNYTEDQLKAITVPVLIVHDTGSKRGG